MPRKQKEDLTRRERKSKHHFLYVLYLWAFLPLVPQVSSYLLSDSKAVLHGCSDHWTLQNSWPMPLLFQMTVCVDVRVMTPGEWTAFSYKSPRSPYYDLALQGDDSALYAWLLGVRHRFPVQLELGRWTRVCLRRDSLRDSFALEISGNPNLQQRTVIAQATPPTGTLLLGCQPQDAPPGATLATLELYLFRVWDDVQEHGPCEDGTIVNWDSRMWGITRPQARVRDAALQCGMIKNVGLIRVKRGISPAQPVTTSTNTRDFLSTTVPLLSTLAVFTTTASSPRQQANINTATSSTASATVTTTANTTATAPLTAATTTTTTSTPSTLAPTITVSPTSPTTAATFTAISPPLTASTSTSTPTTVAVTSTGPTATASTSSSQTTTVPNTITSMPTTTTANPTAIATNTGPLETATTTTSPPMTTYLSSTTSTSTTIATTTTTLPPLTASSTGTTISTTTTTNATTITTTLSPLTASSTGTTISTTTTTNATTITTTLPPLTASSTGTTISATTTNATTTTTTSTPTTASLSSTISTPTTIATTTTTSSPATATSTGTTTSATTDTTTTTALPATATTTTTISASVTTATTITTAATAITNETSSTTFVPEASTASIPYLTTASTLPTLTMSTKADSVHSSTRNIQPNGSTSLTTSDSSVAHTSALTSLFLMATSTGGSESSVNTTAQPTTAASTVTPSYPSLTTLAPTILTVNQTSLLPASTFNTLSTDSAVMVQCNLSQLCDNKTLYYWMFVSVEVAAAGSPSLVQEWFLDLFTSACDLGDVKQSSSTLCQNNSTLKLQDISVDCNDKTNFTKTNCTVLLQLSQPTDTCSIRQLLQQKSRKSSLHAELLGEVGRVGKNLCLDEHMLPPGDGFVYCNNPVPSSGFCQAMNQPISVMCSYENRSFVPRNLSEVQAQPCNNNTQNNCDCSRFCKDSGAFYAFSLNISRGNVTFDDVKNTVTQLDNPCSSTTLSPLCNVSRHYQGVHIECHGNGNRLFSCMVALQVSQPLDLCTVSEALTDLLISSSSITYKGTLARLALCGLPSASSNSLLNSNFTWVSANISAEQFCSLNQFSFTTQFSCGNGQVLGVLLNESCADSSYRSNTTPSTTETSTVFPTQNSSPEISTPFNTTQQTIVPNNSTGIEPNATVSFPNTTVPLTSAVTPVNTTVTPVSVIDETFNATAPSVVIPINSTVIQPSATVSSQNTTVTSFNTVTPTPNNITDTTVDSTASLSSTHTMFNSTNNTAVTPLNDTVSHTTQHALTGLQQTSSQFNTTQANASISTPLTTDSNSELVTLFNTTTPQNASHPSSATPPPQLSTTPENTTQFNTTQFTNDSVTTLSQNTSQSNETVRDLDGALSNTTTLPINTTQYNTTTTKPSLNTSFVTTASAQHITEFNTVTPDTNATMSVNVRPSSANISVYTTDSQTTASVNTTNPNTGSPLYTTASFSNTLEFNSSEQVTNTSHPSANNTSTPVYTTAPYQNTTQLVTDTTEYNNATASVNISAQNTTVYNTNATVSTPSNTSNITDPPLYTSSFNNTTETKNTQYDENVTSSGNITQVNTTSAPFDTTTSSPNITTSPLYTTSSFINVTELNTSAYIENTTALVNITHPETTSSSENTTQPNTTVSSADFNATSPITDTAQTNMTTAENNTTQFNTSTVTLTPDVRDLINNFTQDNTTVFPLNVTEFNTTLIPSNSTTGNTTEIQNTTQFNISAVTLTPDVKDLINNFTQDNTTVSPLNVTEFNTTLIPLNSTTANTTEIQNTTQFNETDIFSTIYFNDTTPTPTVTEMYNYTYNYTTDVFEQNTTTSDENVTQTESTTVLQNLTTENSFTYNVTLNFTTSMNTTNTTDYSYQSSSDLNVTTEPSFTLNISTSITTDSIYNTTFSSDSQLSTTQSNTSTTGNGSENPAATDASNTTSTTTTTTAPVITQTQVTTSSTSTTSTSPAGVPQPAEPTTTTTTTTTQTETTSQSPEAVADELAHMNTSNYNSSQVQELVKKVEDVLSTPNISLNLATTMLSVIDNLLNSSTNAVASSSNRLIKAVDTLALKLFIRDKTESITSGSLALSVTKIDGTNFAGTSLSITDPLSLAVNSRRRRSVSSFNLGSITLPASLTEKLSPEERQQASRLQFTFFKKSTLFQDKNNSLVLNSHILGTSVSNLSITGLRENVVFTLKNKEPVKRNVTCVFWDFKANGGSGGWNSNGCKVVNTSTENQTVCSCNHLTSFAVLMDLSGVVLTDRVQATILTFITYIGCGISAIFLAVTLLSYLAFEKIRRDIPSKILINLCFALLFLNLVYLLDSWLALYPNAVGLCISTAFFLHYFLLASFTWMGLEALHLYLAIVKVFNNMSRYMLKFALAGWGVPLLVVIIVIAVDKNNYGLIAYAQFVDGTTDDFCWLKNKIAFYVAVVAYFCVIFVSNLTMFVVVMVQLRRIKRQNPHNNQHRSGLQDLRSIAGLTFLLGLTWGFAFFAWGPVNLAFTYLFTIFNSLQGFFIFVFHCAIKETVRRQWRTYLCCGKLRLAENSDWSRTATQNNTKKTSLATVNSSRNSQTQSTSRSSSVSTNSNPQSNFINSSTEDGMSTSMEDSSGDVILNEINSQHRPLRRTD